MTRAVPCHPRQGGAHPLSGDSCPAAAPQEHQYPPGRGREQGWVGERGRGTYQEAVLNLLPGPKVSAAGNFQADAQSYQAVVVARGVAAGMVRWEGAQGGYPEAAPIEPFAPKPRPAPPVRGTSQGGSQDCQS